MDGSSHGGRVGESRHRRDHEVEAVGHQEARITERLRALRLGGPLGSRAGLGGDHAEAERLQDAGPATVAAGGAAAVCRIRRPSPSAWANAARPTSRWITWITQCQPPARMLSWLSPKTTTTAPQTAATITCPSGAPLRAPRAARTQSPSTRMTPDAMWTGTRPPRLRVQNARPSRIWTTK